jgi:hypothetical protein
MPEHDEDDPARAEFDDARRSVESVERAGGEAVVNAATATAMGGGVAAGIAPDEAGSGSDPAGDPVIEGEIEHEADPDVDADGIRSDDEWLDEDGAR